MNIGQNIKQLRELKNVTQSYVSDRLNMSIGGYSKIESGQTDVSFSKIQQIAEILETDLATILNFDSKKHIVQMENNKGTIYTSINYGTVNAVNESFLQTIVNLNENIVRLNDIILQINKK